MTKSALGGIAVLEASQFTAGAFCAKLLADLGAEVIKIEPPGPGDETRKRGASSQDTHGAECSALFLYLNTNKLSVTLDLNQAAGRKILGRLLRKADALIIEDTPEHIKGRDLDRDTLRTAHPQLVTAAITPFGMSGPYRDYKSYYLNTFECAGEGYFLPSDKNWELHVDDPPIRMGGFASENNVGVTAAVAVLASLFGREINGTGEFIEMSKQEVLINLVRGELVTYNQGNFPSRATRGWPVGGLMLCKDGWVLLLPLNERLWDRLIQAMGSPAWAKEKKYQYSYVAGTYMKQADYNPQLFEAQNQVNEFLQQWCSQLTMDEICKKVQEAGSSASPIVNVDSILRSPQLRWRNFFTQVEHPRAGRLEYPGVPYIMSETPGRIEKRAPLLGEHNKLVLSERLGYTQEQLGRLRQAGVI